MGPHFNLIGAIVFLMSTYFTLYIYVLLTEMLQYLELYVECSTPFVFLELLWPFHCVCLVYAFTKNICGHNGVCSIYDLEMCRATYFLPLSTYFDNTPYFWVPFFIL